MKMNWDYYNELYMGIPSGIRVENCVVGKLWTAVRAGGGNVGVVRTMGEIPADPESYAADFAGGFLRDTANVLRWDSLVRAGVGMAALNAFYNLPALEKSSGPPAFLEDLGQGPVSVIGDLPNLSAGLDLNGPCINLPLPEHGCVDGEYKEAMGSPVVFISGDSLTTGVLHELLDAAGAETRISLAGISVPGAPILFAYDSPVRNLTGLYARDSDAVEKAVREDAPELELLMGTFSINPKKPKYLHERPEVQRYMSSPYRASVFNCAFNPWEGKEYDHSTWSPIFKG